MTDDIVKYLRLSQTQFNRHAEAADEIERLRKDMGQLSAILIALGTELQGQADGSDA